MPSQVKLCVLAQGLFGYVNSLLVWSSLTLHSLGTLHLIHSLLDAAGQCLWLTTIIQFRLRQTTATLLVTILTYQDMLQLRVTNHC